jgi:hypothetical protein
MLKKKYFIVLFYGKIYNFINHYNFKSTQQSVSCADACHARRDLSDAIRRVEQFEYEALHPSYMCNIHFY